MNLLTRLERTGRLPLFVMISFMSTFFVAMLLLRIRITGSANFVFLIWNLFLAYIPYCIGLIIYTRQTKLKLPSLLLLVSVWLLFLPNAPYLMTDIAHLTTGDGIGMWYNLMLLISFAAIGMIITMMTLYDVHSYLRRYYNPGLVWGFMIAAVYGCGIGIYVGRFLRWNSWDMITQPVSLLEEGADHFISGPNPVLQAGFAILLGTFILMLYTMAWYTLKVFAKKEIELELRASMPYSY
jgi:uncharacterized membrane protein